MTMNHPIQTDHGSIRSRSTSRSTAWRAVLLTALVSLAFAGPSTAQCGGSGGGPGFTSGGDETVGTLPIVGQIHIDLPVVGGWRGNHPAFYLEGTPAELGILIRGARGAGFATYEALDPHASRIRLAFHGAVTLVLDRELLGMLRVQTGVAVPTSFDAREMTIGWGGNPTRTMRLRSGLLFLPVPSLSADGVLDQGPLRMHAIGRDGAHSDDTVFATPQTVVLRQSN
jgi:hypothetical protein